MFLDFWKGLCVPYSGLKYIFKHPSLLALAVIPFLINIATILGSFSFIYNNSHWPKMIVNQLGISSDAGWFFWFAHNGMVIFVWFTLAVLSIIVAYLTGQIIAAPFSSFLAERTLTKCGGQEEKPFNLKAWAKLSARMIRVSLFKILIFVPLGGFLFILSLIPIIMVPAQLGILLMLAFDCCDYSFESLGLTLRQRIGMFLKGFWGSLGIAIIIGLILVVPGLNFFLFPATVVGSALMIAEEKKD